MAWERTDNGYKYVDSCSGELRINVKGSHTLFMEFEGWYVNEGTLLELATALLALRKEVCGTGATILENPCVDIIGKRPTYITTDDLVYE